jgi:23S rRNA-/tRNA-specific pseudouridylate synthase
VHLYSIGHPVLGDDRYGRDRPVGGVGRLMLHASELTVPPVVTLRYHLTDTGRCCGSRSLDPETLDP